MANNGYSWWYVDALSTDGRHGLTAIAFIGSVFSPYYALARARGGGDPENHVAMNVALDGKPTRWAMTERGRASLSRAADHIAIGPSGMSWDGEALTITVDELTVPVPTRLRGRIVVRPRVLGGRRFHLDAARRHRWQPIGPLSDVSVTFERPELSWQGTGYFDTNDGDEPLEDAFRSWTWARFDTGSGARIFYDVIDRAGEERRLSLEATTAGVSDARSLAFQPLPKTIWGVSRAAPCDEGSMPTLLRTMENAPFYARSVIRSRIDGVDITGVHESLSLTRATSPVVRAMLPFKMFRRGAASHGRVRR